MRVKDVMKRAVCICPDEPVSAAARVLKAHNVGCLPVCDDGRVIGIVTDRDIVMRGVVDARRAEQTTVREVMSIDALVCSPDDPAGRVVERLRGARVRRAAVVDRAGRVVGVVSLTDFGESGSARRPFEIVFYKEILDHGGFAHRSELMRVAVGQGPRDAAIRHAVRAFQAYAHVSNWRTAADGYEVIETHAGP